MAKQNRTTLKGYFETGDIPTQTQYADLIDSNLNLSELNSFQKVLNRLDSFEFGSDMIFLISKN